MTKKIQINHYSTFWPKWSSLIWKPRLRYVATPLVFYGYISQFNIGTKYLSFLRINYVFYYISLLFFIKMSRNTQKTFFIYYLNSHVQNMVTLLVNNSYWIGEYSDHQAYYIDGSSKSLVTPIGPSTWRCDNKRSRHRVLRVLLPCAWWREQCRGPVSSAGGV